MSTRKGECEPNLGDDGPVVSGTPSTDKKVQELPSFHLKPIDLLRPFELLSVNRGAVYPRNNKNTVEVRFVSGDGKMYETSQGQPEAEKTFAHLFPTEKDPLVIIYGSRHEAAVLFMYMKEEKGGLSLHDLHVLGGNVTRALAKKRFTHANIYLKGLPVARDMTDTKLLTHFVHGLQTPTYIFDDLKSKKDDRMSLRGVGIHGLTLSEEAFSEACDRVNNLVLTEHYMRLWVDMPTQPNCKGTQELITLGRQIVGRATEGVATCAYIEGEKLNELGLNLIWGVGKGRMPENPPALLTLSYMGGGKKAPIIAIVGKGIVFDTGGEQMKPGDSMLGMKADMGGAATVISVIDHLVRTEAKVNVVGLAALADNSVSHTSIHAGVVLRAYDGTTVEVIDTDAEGRLVLADAIAYAEKHYKPDYLITIATLTGAAVVAFGNQFAALYGKTDFMKKTLLRASSKTWNEIWPAPLTEARLIKLKPSKIADMTNLGERWGGSISAAKFVMAFVRKTQHAAHLDIAPVGMDGYDSTDEQQKCSGGSGPALLLEAIQMLSEKKQKKSRKVSKAKS